METFAWDSNFVTNIDSIDTQHHQLVDLFNALNISLFSSEADRSDVVASAFAQVVDYAHYHFKDEEQLMRDAGVHPGHIETHKALHDQFVEQVHALWAQRQIITNNPEIFIGFLTSWLGMHILGVDQSLARQVRRIREGMDPKHAWDLEGSAHDNSTQALLKMINKLYTVLSAQNAELAAANSKLEERVRQRTDQLAEANTELQDANQKLKIFSRTDGLLQIANRGYFDDEIELACAHSRRRSESVGLLMIDVDFFKRYNDAYGHQAGDECLKAVAKAVRDSLQRKTDLVARYGGEELVVILPNTNHEGTQEIAKRIVGAVASLAIPHETSDAANHVTVSVGGVTTIAQGDDDSKRMIAAADDALYKAKNAGRNRYCLASSA